MKMHLLSGGRLRMRKSVYFPDADRSETIEIPVSCALLRHRQGNVLFDTGCHPSVPDNPQARWGELAKLMVPIMPNGDNVVTGLAGIGLQCGDIDIVVSPTFGEVNVIGMNMLSRLESWGVQNGEMVLTP